jgi:hypothetical protein
VIRKKKSYEAIYNLHVVSNSSILVDNCSSDMRVFANTNRNAAFSSQKPPISIRLQHTNQKTNTEVSIASQAKVESY